MNEFGIIAQTPPPRKMRTGAGEVRLPGDPKNHTRSDPQGDILPSEDEAIPEWVE